MLAEGQPPQARQAPLVPGPRWVRAATVHYGHRRSPTVAQGPEESQVAGLPAQTAGRMRAGDSDCGPEGHRTMRTVLMHRRSGPSTVNVAASPSAVRLGPELPLKLHEAPDPDAIRADVRLDVGGRLADGHQVYAKQLRAPLERRRDRPAHVGVVPGPHCHSLSNTRSRSSRECYLRRPDEPLGHIGGAEHRQ
jgi:hypothetical protein